MAESKYIYKVGRRKTATATLRLYKSKGSNEVNGKELDKYFPTGNYVTTINQVYRVAELKPDDFYFTVKVTGSGVNAQAEAIRHALARAVVENRPEAKTAVKKAGFLTRDPRMVERKKPGLRKARKSEQFSKR